MFREEEGGGGVRNFNEGKGGAAQGRNPRLFLECRSAQVPQTQFRPNQLTKYDPLLLWCGEKQASPHLLTPQNHLLTPVDANGLPTYSVISSTSMLL